MMMTNNSVVSVAQPRAVAAQTQDRFRPRSGEPPRTAETDAQASLIPGDRATHALPVRCYVEWEAAKLRGAPNGAQWERVGRLSVPYSLHLAKAVFRSGVLVKFREQQPGKENSWYALETVVVQPPMLAGQLRVIECELREVAYGVVGS